MTVVTLTLGGRLPGPRGPGTVHGAVTLVVTLMVDGAGWGWDVGYRSARTDRWKQGCLYGSLVAVTVRHIPGAVERTRRGRSPRSARGTTQTEGRPGARLPGEGVGEEEMDDGTRVETRRPRETARPAVWPEGAPRLPRPPHPRPSPPFHLSGPDFNRRWGSRSWTKGDVGRRGRS